LPIGRRIAGAARSDVQRALRQKRTQVKTFGPLAPAQIDPICAPGLVIVEDLPAAPNGGPARVLLNPPVAQRDWSSAMRPSPGRHRGY
jgi:hypothetical protein